MPETEKSTQKSNSIKLLAVIMAMLFMVGGFFLLPGPEDWRDHAYDVPVGRFLDSFHAVQEPENDLSLPEATLTSSENRKVEFKELIKGRVTIVNFWASWCAPCLEELPSLVKFQAANPDILLVPVSLDMAKTLPELAKIFEADGLRDLRWFYDQDGEMRKALSLPVYPSTYILDKEGKIIYILQGPSDWGSHDASMFGKFLLSKS